MKNSTTFSDPTPWVLVVMDKDGKLSKVDPSAFEESVRFVPEGFKCFGAKQYWRLQNGKVKFYDIA